MRQIKKYYKKVLQKEFKCDHDAQLAELEAVKGLKYHQVTWTTNPIEKHPGRGRHPAALNLGDCFSYALSKQTGEPLLFKGHDFKKTDLLSVEQA